MCAICRLPMPGLRVAGAGALGEGSFRGWLGRLSSPGIRHDQSVAFGCRLPPLSAFLAKITSHKTSPVESPNQSSRGGLSDNGTCVPFQFEHGQPTICNTSLKQPCKAL